MIDKDEVINIGSGSDGFSLEVQDQYIMVNQEDDAPKKIKTFLEYLGFTNVEIFEDY